MNLPKIDVATVSSQATTNYPQQFRSVVQGRSRQRLGNAAGLTQFGVNICRLAPGAASSLRHWHMSEDEFVYMLEGEVVLVEDEGETTLKPGDAAAWKAGSTVGHHLVNRGTRDAVFLEVGTRAARDRVEYPDVDLLLEKDEAGVRRLHKNGEAYTDGT